MRIFIIHGWGGNPKEGWFPWFKEKMTAVGHEVFIPAMPNAAEPKIEEWVTFLASQVGQPDENTILIGHSIGAQAIMRYLETIDQRIDKAIFVAGWFTLKDLESDEEWVIAKPWLEIPIDFEKVKRNTKQIQVILSTNDSWVPLEENKEIFEKRLNGNVITLANKGHLSGEHGVFELPEIMNLID